MEQLLEEKLFKKSLCINTKAISEFFSDSPQKTGMDGKDYNRQLVEVLEQTIKPTFSKMVNNGSSTDLNPLLVARRETQIYDENSVGHSDMSGSPIRFGKDYISPNKKAAQDGPSERGGLLSVVRVQEQEEDHSSDDSSKQDGSFPPPDRLGVNLVTVHPAQDSASGSGRAHSLVPKTINHEVEGLQHGEKMNTLEHHVTSTVGF